MRRVLVSLSFAVLALCSVAQNATVPGPSTSSVVLNWALPANCTAANPCTFIGYRVNGSVTITAGTTGATVLPTTAAQAITLTDSTPTAGATVSYAVETVQGGRNAAPSNTLTFTIPQPPPPVVLTGGTASNTSTITVKNGTLSATATTTSTVRVKAGK